MAPLQERNPPTIGENINPMEMPFGSVGEKNNQLVPYGESLTIDTRAGIAGMYGSSEQTESPSIDVRKLVARYWLLLVSLVTLGAAGGFVSVVLSSPMYRTSLLLEVQGINLALKDGVFGGGIAESNEIDIQTEINILHGGSFLKRGADRMQSESVPLAPTGRDLFSRLRQRLHPATQDPLENARRGLAVAVQTFDARPVARTRLIELSCASTSPDVAAQFLNAMAAEFAEDTSRSRMQSSQKTSEWLAAQIEETKSKVQESEEHLRDFVQASGNVFAGQDNTLEDTKLAQLKGELAKIQAERIARQARYELTQKNPPETLGEILDDVALKGYQGQISSLDREKAVLETTYTSKNEKVRKVDVQLALLKKTYLNEVTSVVNRIKNDYDAALRQEKLLSAAYNGQSQRVGAEAGKAAQYNALRREVETLRQMYQSLLMQSNQVGLNSSVPINPIRIVEPSNPPDAPYKPQPVLNISFGTMLGFAIAAGLVFLRERMDHSIKSPGMSRRLLNTPELGVIPNLSINGNGAGRRTIRNDKNPSIEAALEDPAAALVTWQNGPAFVAESFRGTLASILRNQAGRKQKTILVTSAGPAEGKTTVIQNLGIALAETGAKVLLVDADFRRPYLHHKFGLPNEFSLIDLISENTPLDQYAAERFGVPSGFAGLSVLPNRPTRDNVSKALYSPRLRAIFEILINRYDTILVDAPPILNVADTRIMAPLTDALILVLRCGVTHRDAALEAYRRIQEDGLSLLGTVLTDYDLSAEHKRQYYYAYDEQTRP
jgi:succinoglycan biosynthesis transport protein ExoP